MRALGKSSIALVLTVAFLATSHPALARGQRRTSSGAASQVSQLKTRPGRVLRQHGSSHPADDVDRMTLGGKIADKVAVFTGSWKGLALLATGVGSWIGAHNMLGDPELIKLNLAISIVTMLTGPLVLMSQNRSGARDRKRAEEDLEIDKRSEARVNELNTKIDAMSGQLALMNAALQAQVKQAPLAAPAAKK